MSKVQLVTVRRGRQKSSDALSNQSLSLPGDWSKMKVTRREGEFLLPIGTAWVERDVLGVAEEVHRISRGKLRVASCQCGRCLDHGHFPHVVLELTKLGYTAPVFGFTSFGPHVIDRVRQIRMGTGHHEKMLKDNERIRKERNAEAKALADEKLEIIQAALDSPKQDWRGPNGIRTEALRTRL